MSSPRFVRRDSLKRKAIALSVAACFSLSATEALANPTGGTVVSGSASFASSGNTLTITNSANAIINWQNFSIGVNEITRFLQSSGSSAVLNRVVGSNGAIPQSIIDGVLSSNGRVFLINPSGVVIGSTGRVDVAGFVASSLTLSDQDFLAGRMRFTETPGAGKVSNAGTIDTSSAGPGGRVWLVGPDVQNSGVIRSPQGEIILAAGKSVELVAENSPFVTVTITADSERALNVGRLLADSGRIGMFGALVRQGGVAEANSAVLGANGEIRLVATKDLTLDEGSRTTANGPSGGSVTLQAQGGTNLIYGTVEAKGSSGQGGTIQALGVRVGVLGHGVIDASGEAGGGTVLVGGDQHGANPNIQNAEQTLIGPDGVIRADAATTGDGGRVIVWSDAYTQVFGSVSARGGAQSGNGGFIETSSGGGMDMTGVRIDTRAPNGLGGTWLIDPLNVVIEPNSYAGGYALVGGILGFASNPGQTLHITEQTLETNFANVGTTSIQATQDVLFHANLNLAYATVTPVQTFEIRAVRNIDLAADGVAHSITTNGQNVTLSASDIGSGLIATLDPNGTGSIVGGGTITTNGGNVNLSGYGINVGAITTSVVTPTTPALAAGNVTMLSSGGDITTGSISTRATTPPNGAVSPGGFVAISSTYGNIAVYGNIDTRGAAGFDTRSSAQGTDGGAVVLVRSTTLTPGKITVTGDIITSGGDGTVSTAALNGIPNGGTGGYISIGANNSGGVPGQVSAAYGDVAIGGNLITRGGNGGTSPAGLNGGNGGSGGVIIITATNNVKAGSSAQNVIDATGGKGGAGSSATSSTFGSSGGNGGAGGVISLNGGVLTLPGGVISVGGAGGIGGATAIIGYGGGSGGAGGFGGSVTLSGTGEVVAATISTAGGYGGAGGAASGSATAGSGSSGGSGGQVSLSSTNAYVNVGTIFTSSGNGGDAGGTGAGASAAGTGGGVIISAGTTIYAGDITTSAGKGGITGNTLTLAFGGQAGAVNMNATGNITTGSITAVGGAGATATVNGQAYAGGTGSGGNIVIGSNGSVTTGAIDASGGSASYVSIGALGDITTDGITARSLSPIAAGSNVGLSTSTGRITVKGNIDVRGSDGKAVLIDTCGDGCIVAAYGASNGGSVSLIRNGQGDPVGGPAIQVTGTIFAYGGAGFSPQNSAGGAGGAGGTVGIQSVYGGNGATYGAIAVLNIDAHGGSGGASSPGFIGAAGGTGGSVAIQGATISTGTINVAGGAGGAGGADAGNGGGNGGAGGTGGDVALLGATTINSGDIVATGGDGGKGGDSSLANLGGYGGAGGSGGLVDVITNALPGSSANLGNVFVFGGKGGDGGSSTGGTGGAGGVGGSSGELFVDPESAKVGAVTAFGGAGGKGGAGGLQGGAGGAGGSGADIGINGLAYAGSITVGSIDVSGGAGGAGGSSGTANVYGGLGGAGGSGGFVDVGGGAILDLTSASAIKVSGGAGGAGGSGVGGYGGNGGFGGSGGLVSLTTATSSTAYGQILTLVPLTSLVNVAGGTGGAGGATGGVGGTNGSIGVATVNGVVIITGGSSNLDTNTTVQSTNGILGINTPPPLEDTQKKNEQNKKKDQVAACK